MPLGLGERAQIRLSYGNPDSAAFTKVWYNEYFHKHSKASSSKTGNSGQGGRPSPHRGGKNHNPEPQKLATERQRLEEMSPWANDSES